MLGNVFNVHIVWAFNPKRPTKWKYIYRVNHIVENNNTSTYNIKTKKDFWDVVSWFKVVNIYKHMKIENEGLKCDAIESWQLIHNKTKCKWYKITFRKHKSRLMDYT